MTRQLTITAAEWASRGEEGRLWLMREGVRWGTAHLEANAPPAEFALACAPCETEDITCHCGCEGPCNACRIELVGPCPTCRGWTRCEGDGKVCPTCDQSGTVTLGYGYAVGEPMPIVAFGSGHGLVGRYLVVVNQKVFLIVNEKLPVDATKVTDQLAHAGPPESLVGKWAMCIEVKKERT